MTLSSTKRIIDYTGNDATFVFPYDFIIPAASDLLVELWSITTGLKTLTVAAGNMNVTGLGDATFGSVEYPFDPEGVPVAIDTDTRIVIQRLVPFTQLLDIQNQGGFNAEAIENQLDREVMQIQQLAEQVARAALLADGSDTVGLVFPEPSAEDVIGWNAAATQLENKTVGTVGAVLAALGINSITVSTLNPSGGVDNDIWFKVPV